MRKAYKMPESWVIALDAEDILTSSLGEGGDVVDPSNPDAGEDNL